MNKKLNQAIYDVLEKFDFERVQKTMTALGWTWASVAGDGIPSVNTIKAQAEILLEGCVREFESRGSTPYGMTYGTGGLEARIDCFPNGEPELSLLFYAEKTRSNGEY